MLVSRKNREISDVQLQQSIAVTTRNVKNAYWDLVFAINNLAVQRQSLQLAQQSFRDNRARVEIGTMAPLDIVQAEAEVAQREEGVILAEAAISRAEDTLRALISNPDRSARVLEHATRAGRPARLPAGHGRRRRRRAQRAGRRAPTWRLAQAASRPTTSRFATSATSRCPTSTRWSTTARSAWPARSSSLSHGLPAADAEPDPARLLRRARRRVRVGLPDLVVQLQVNYPIGASNAEANLARARLQNTQARKQLQSSELQVATQIRDLARNVQTNAKRVEATRASRALAEKRLEAEEKKFQAGMTSSFLVIQAQRDLSQARNSELQAIIDYLKSVVDFETAQQAPLARRWRRHDRAAVSRSRSKTSGSERFRPSA